MSRPGTDSQKMSKLSWFRNWVTERLGSDRHERRVACIAASLVDLTFPLHDLTIAERRLLRIAALVHDVGRCVSKKNHPSAGARIIRRCPELPLKKRQRRALAYLTLRHRGEVPGVQDDPALRRVENVPRLQMLLAFLRAADALDSRSLPSPRLTFTRKGRRIRILCRLRDDCAEARRIFSRRKKFRLLEDLLDCRVEVAILSNRRLRAVA
jgi:exopolyphosphatase/pppGpp-phosphohydrolase